MIFSKPFISAEYSPLLRSSLLWVLCWYQFQSYQPQLLCLQRGFNPQCLGHFVLLTEQLLQITLRFHGFPKTHCQGPHLPSCFSHSMSFQLDCAVMLLNCGPKSRSLEQQASMVTVSQETAGGSQVVANFKCTSAKILSSEGFPGTGESVPRAFPFLGQRLDFLIYFLYFITWESP